MKTLRTWNNDDLDLIEGEIAKQGERIELTHWKAWDNIFGGIERGSIYMIASTTGGGKSTLLLASGTSIICIPRFFSCSFFITSAFAQAIIVGYSFAVLHI